jgi:hypothetical protein
MYQGLLWSPKGRYVLTHIKTEADVCWFAILDTRQGRWFEIPDTFQTSTPSSASANWMDDGKIMVVNIASQTESPITLINFWQVISTSNELLVLEKEIKLNNLKFPKLNQFVSGEIYYTAGWLEQIREQVICFVIISKDSNQELFLYFLDIEQEIPYLANHANIQATDVLWPPDGSGALLIEGSSKILFAPIDGSEPSQITDLIGKNIHDFTWAPPAPRL